MNSAIPQTRRFAPSLGLIIPNSHSHSNKKTMFSAHGSRLNQYWPEYSGFHLVVIVPCIPCASCAIFTADRFPGSVPRAVRFSSVGVGLTRFGLLRFV